MGHVFLLLSGCASGTRGEDTAPCTRAAFPVALEESAPNGQIPSTVLAGVPAEATATFTYAVDGATTPIQLSFDGGAAQARWVDLTRAQDAAGRGSACVDFLQIDLPTSLATDDGALVWSDTLTFTVGAGGEEEGLLVGGFVGPREAFTGDFDWSDYGEVGEENGNVTDSVEASLLVRMLPDGATTGEIETRLSGHNEERAWESHGTVGTW